MTRVALITVAFWLIWTVFTTVFAISAKKTEVRALPKWLWVLICLLVPFFGGLLYLMVGRPLRRPDQGGMGGRGKTVAPDDDPNFLRDLNNKLRKKDEDDKK